MDILIWQWYKSIGWNLLRIRDANKRILRISNTLKTKVISVSLSGKKRVCSSALMPLTFRFVFHCCYIEWIETYFAFFSLRLSLSCYTHDLIGIQFVVYAQILVELRLQNASFNDFFPESQCLSTKECSNKDIKKRTFVTLVNHSKTFICFFSSFCRSIAIESKFCDCGKSSCVAGFFFVRKKNRLI